jgi:hypothetical protein
MVNNYILRTHGTIKETKDVKETSSHELKGKRGSPTGRYLQGERGLEEL